MLNFASGGLLTYFWRFCESSPVQSSPVHLSPVIRYTQSCLQFLDKRGNALILLSAMKPHLSFPFYTGENG